jgi:hypothetical protein
MVLSRPKDRNARARQIRELRLRALHALDTVAAASSVEERATAQDECCEALRSLLIGTLPPKMLIEASADFPALLQPTLPFRSPSE